MATRFVALAVALCGIFIAASCGGDLTPPPPPPVKIASIQIDSGNRQLERGTVVNLTAIAKDASGKVIASVPFAWRSSLDSVASVDFNGKLTAGVPGTALVTASALGVSSQAITVQVVWQGPAQILAYQFTPPNAITPGSGLNDSIRVAVANAQGNAAKGGRVAFKVTGGGGSVTPAFAPVPASGIVAAKWILGPNVGLNTVTATVVGADDLQVPWVQKNPVTFSVKSYNALAVVQGDNQSAPLLAPLGVVPRIKLVDSLGKPRPGVPITFSASSNGFVADSVASTGADGVTSPGVWTLGDGMGAQQLTVSVEGASIVLHATATGSPLHYTTSFAMGALNTTCVIGSNQLVSCMGPPNQNGTADTGNVSTPKPTKGGIQFTSIAGGISTHFCGTTPDLSIYCWGPTALVDTLNGISSTGTAQLVLQPTRLQSNIAWLQVAPGFQHTCALANDHTAYCWGIDTTGQLGDGLTTRHLMPRPVAGGFKFNSVTSGTGHACGITVDSLAYCWGANGAAQLGDGTAALRLTPTAVASSLHWKLLAAGDVWTCGLTSDGTAYCWGGHTLTVTPTAVINAPKFTSLIVGGDHACGLASDGTPWCWGDNDNAQLGDGTFVFRPLTAAPVAGTLKFTQLGAGVEHTCGITTDGLLACWGLNSVGELGLTTFTRQTVPRLVIVGVTP